MSQNIFVAMRELITFAQLQQTIQQMQATTPDIIVQSPTLYGKTPNINIERGPTFISVWLDVQAPYYSEFPEEAGTLFYESGFSVTPEDSAYIHSILVGPIRSIVDINMSWKEGSERLAMQLVEALAAYGPLIIDMNWGEVTNYFTLAELQPFMTPDELNPIGHFWHYCEREGIIGLHP